MRKLMLVGIAVIAVAVSAWFAVAQPPARPGGGRQGGNPRPGGRDFGTPPFPLMIALDTNKDGELSAEEITKAAESLKKLDKNGDGKLLADELRPQFGPDEPGGPPPMGGRQGALEAAPTAKDGAEKKILKLLEEIPQKQGRMMNVPPTDGRLLRLLAEAIEAKHVVEIGTSNGISSIWLALALQKTGGKLTTYEIDPQTAALARKNFEAAGVGELITIVEGNAHEMVSKLKGPIDLVFIDADKEGYSDYLEKLLPLVRPGGLVLAHNMNPRMADQRFVEAITKSPALETLFYVEGGGMSVSLKKR